jgi:hypothetical protein
MFSSSYMRSQGKVQCRYTAFNLVCSQQCWLKVRERVPRASEARGDVSFLILLLLHLHVVDPQSFLIARKGYSRGYLLLTQKHDIIIAICPHLTQEHDISIAIWAL